MEGLSLPYGVPLASTSKVAKQSGGMINLQALILPLLSLNQTSGNLIANIITKSLDIR